MHKPDSFARPSYYIHPRGPTKENSSRHLNIIRHRSVLNPQTSKGIAKTAKQAGHWVRCSSPAPPCPPAVARYLHHQLCSISTPSSQRLPGRPCSTPGCRGEASSWSRGTCKGLGTRGPRTSPLEVDSWGNEKQARVLNVSTHYHNENQNELVTQK